MAPGQGMRQPASAQAELLASMRLGGQVLWKGRTSTRHSCSAICCSSPSSSRAAAARRFCSMRSKRDSAAVVGVPLLAGRRRRPRLCAPRALSRCR